MAPQTTSKKRKRADSSADQVTISVFDKSPSAVGPILASFPALDPSKSAAFAAYAPPQSPSKTNGAANKNAGREQEFSRRPLLVAGETDAIEFHSTGENEAVRGGSRYLIGIHNKRTNTLLLRPAPLQILGRRVKALKNLAPAPSTSSTERIEQRNTLGEMFGTRKAQKAIRTAERNRVDVDAMEGVVGHIQESVESGTRGLPSQEEAKELADSTRQIPKFNLHATKPEDVYKLYDIVPESELNALPIKEIMNATSQEERMKFVPFSRSDWVRQHVAAIFEGTKTSKRSLRIILYIACLLVFRMGAVRYCNKREDLEERLPGIPSNVIDGIYSRFTETVRGSSRVQFTSDNAVRLLTHIFALCLHVDNFATDTTLIAADLREPVTKINQHFKLLGCKIEKLSTVEMSRLGLSASGAEHKRAVLRVPLEFPKARMKRRN
ncbi:Rpa49 subunit specific to nuclear RNA polymerase I [Fomitiporia mediterranea MF3/22]|uniref:Rpa49 subunit specific to nuclear RNA polymerase I n=1 Tax=Fomitiporia mediterranea (strain MF3/22) TaxID=694068 RepID=UPI0004409A9D|nr:Rpa49 subunit specific to nuclear RNA polymerase I [Fomitiporia mediterranea MF3/22]EJD05049.1 Rpa49 subunit specific to nuclear RNA polymerase I [Fomitiporia mediterranea MF3/22]